MSDPAKSPGPETLFPAKPIDAGGTDLGKPTADYLRALGLLPRDGEVARPSAALLGTPDSIAVIEAGATALSKGWAAGMGVAILAAWGSVKHWYPSQDTDLQRTVILAAAIGTAAFAAGIAYIVAADVRGRAAASVATIKARALVAEVMLRESAALYEPEPDTAPSIELHPLAPVLPVKWRPRDASEDEDWIASVVRINGDKIEYRLSKGREAEWVSVGDITFH